MDRYARQALEIALAPTGVPLVDSARYMMMDLFAAILLYARVHPISTVVMMVVLYNSKLSLRLRLFARKRVLSHVQEELRACKHDLRHQLKVTKSSPLMLRLAWSDAATFDKSIRNWPQCGGANGAVRFQSEYRHENNRGLFKALCLLEPVKAAHPKVGWADIIQMAGALAVEVTGGPEIRGMLYGRLDSPNFHEERNAVSCPMHSPTPIKPQQQPTTVDGSADSRSGGAAGAATGFSGEASVGTSADDDIRKKLSAQQQQQKPPMRARVVKDRRKHLHDHLGPDGGSGLGPGIAQLATRLPQATPPFSDGAQVPGVHIRNVFYRMGFGNSDIVALCGAHTIGRAFSDRSHCTIYSAGPQGATKYTRPTACPTGSNDSAKAAAAAINLKSVNAAGEEEQDGEEEEDGGVGMAGGCSWTRNWLHFDNSYFRTVTASTTTAADHAVEEMIDELNFTNRPQARNPVSQNWMAHGRDPELLWLPTDNALQTDPEFRNHFQRYADDQEAFFADYVVAHKKMSELGARFDETFGPISI